MRFRWQGTTRRLRLLLDLAGNLNCAPPVAASRTMRLLRRPLHRTLRRTSVTAGHFNRSSADRTPGSDPTLRSAHRLSTTLCRSGRRSRATASSEEASCGHEPDGDPADRRIRRRAFRMGFRPSAPGPESNSGYGDGEKHVNPIESAWALFKRGLIGVYHDVNASTGVSGRVRVSMVAPTREARDDEVGSRELRGMRPSREGTVTAGLWIPGALGTTLHP